MRFLTKLQRETNSKAFIPEIDGLRFVAIVSVFLCHFNIFYILKNEGGYSTSSADYGILNSVTANGTYGVHLFFAISGFILFLPFAKHYLKGDRKPFIKDYYLRRLTRIEPPYIVVMVLLFLAGVFVLHQYTLSKAFPSLLASLTYTHNFFYGRNELPLINAVAWSLEIEVQFYLIAPLLARMFLLKQRVRRKVMIAAILLFIVLQHLFVLPFMSLFDFIHYFLIGFLLADLYVSGKTYYKNVSQLFIILAGIFVFCAIWSYRVDAKAALWVKIGWELLLTGLMFVFFHLVLFTDFWRSILSKKILTTIGGMCYTIYLLHNPVIWTFDNLPFNRKFTNSYLVDWGIHFVLISFLVLAISAVFFILVEKPCMKRDWVQNLFSRLKIKER